ncbi:MAG: menaquinone biosynthesis protein [Acidobacteriales bacterium]|nr:menaquinone biosynthesis protein [Terriglobales bacterium]
MRKLRISAISYLNTAPLMWDFEHGEAGSVARTDFDISYTVPARCAEQLAEGTADIGIIPTAAYPKISGLAILPGVAIASLREVRSILLVCRKPLEEVQNVALDASSMTSAALTKILFAKWWGGARNYTAMNPDLDSMLADHEGALLIGDPALKVDRSRYLTFDLGQEWVRSTGKPFVYAFWAVRQAALDESDLANLGVVFQMSRDDGLRPHNLAQIAVRWAPRLGLSEGQIEDYLTENIHYFLDAACLDGLELFYQYAGECGALPPSTELNFLSTAKAAVT